MLTREVLVLFHSTLAAVTNTARGFPSPSTRSESPHLPLYVHSWLVHHPLSLREKEPSTLDVSQSIIPLSCTIESIPGLIRSNLPSSFQPSNYQWEVEPTPPLFSCRKITLAAACDQDIEDGIQYLSSTGWWLSFSSFPWLRRQKSRRDFPLFIIWATKSTCHCIFLCSFRQKDIISKIIMG